MITGLALGAEPQDPSESDALALQGKWSIVSVEIEGQSLAMDKLKDSRLSVNNDVYQFDLGKTRLTFSFRLDASKSPKND